VNATPLGTKGKLENETPIFAEQIKSVKLVYDLVYNPFETQFLREARSVGVPTIGGLAMLVSQAMEQFKIWTQLDAPMKEMSQAAFRRL
jgi:shikimate 5-dehydrogenase